MPWVGPPALAEHWRPWSLLSPPPPLLGHPSWGTVLSRSPSDGFIFILKDAFTFLLSLCHGMPLAFFPSSGFAPGTGEGMVLDQPWGGSLWGGCLWLCPPGASPAALGRAGLGIPTALLLPESCFSGLGIKDIPFGGGSNGFFILRGVLGKH